MLGASALVHATSRPFFRATSVMMMLFSSATIWFECSRASRLSVRTSRRSVRRLNIASRVALRALGSNGTYSPRVPGTALYMIWSRSAGSSRRPSRLPVSSVIAIVTPRAASSRTTAFSLARRFSGSVSKVSRRMFTMSRWIGVSPLFSSERGSRMLSIPCSTPSGRPPFTFWWLSL